MRPLGKTIQIYCPTGEPRGVRIAEITTRIVQAVVVPRAKIDEALDREELTGVGFYFLFGESEAGGLQLVYIGEAENCSARLRDHHRRKDFWNVAISFVSRTGSFTKAHCKLLEWLSIERASKARRYQLENGNAGSQPTVPEWMRADVAEVLETADVLLGTLGFPVFDPPVHLGSHDDSHIFFCRRGGAEARGVYNEEGFVVLAGSIARAEVMTASLASVAPRREELLASGALVAKPDGLVFTRDVPFTSPSAAAAVVCGGSANGWVEWKNAAGRTLDDVYRREPRRPG